MAMILISVPFISGQAESPGGVHANGALCISADSIKYLNIPERSASALKGSEFMLQVAALDIPEREAAVVREVLSGNVPSFSRKMQSFTFSENMNGENYEVELLVTCDYLAIGSDLDYCYIPLTPATSQFLAGKLSCTLPTKKVVDLIYQNATYKLDPQPIPPSDSMATVPVFIQHADSIKQQIRQKGLDRSTDGIIAGHKKDIILSNKIYDDLFNSGRVVIYGWHLAEGKPIQPVYNGHGSSYADYSHGVRFMSKTLSIDGDLWKVDKVLKDSLMSKLLSSEGIIGKPFYPASVIQ